MSRQIIQFVQWLLILFTENLYNVYNSFIWSIPGIQPKACMVLTVQITWFHQTDGFDLGPEPTFIMLIICSLYHAPKPDKEFKVTFTHLEGCRKCSGKRDEYPINRLIGWPDEGPPPVFSRSTVCPHACTTGWCQTAGELPGQCRDLNQSQKSSSLSTVNTAATYQALLKRIRVK